ncbi:MAG: DUF2029 domain-containing protein [Candidatus Hydrogenedentota bacterium]|uniref:Putative conserved integral membrane protein n=1 Tax=Sumerlaea chitinivorans TaxID=2250252 RepID=A0A2Z4Y9F9_SUMC1|nr:putative conserved integral membrane protein [Candidatus Sumerlaea chitinivorans]RMH24988.1 MAG: DUF2029 domain-containing protein [Candidatus Hydrogenedentota bacterium]
MKWAKLETWAKALAMRVSTLSRPKKLVLIFLAWLILAGAVSLLDWRADRVRRDFTAYSLQASRTLYAGGDPYAREEARTSYKYFPLNAVLLGPFTNLPIPVAQGIWTATNCFLLGFCLYAHRRWMPRDMRIPWWVWLVALAIAGRFFIKNIRLGQWNTSVYCLSFLGLLALHRAREVTGALTLSLAAALKYMPSFFTLYWIARREWRKALLVLLGGIFWILVFPTVILGPTRHAELLEKYWAKATKQYKGMTEAEYTSSHSLRSTLVRLTSDVKPRLPDPDRYDFTVVRLDKNLARALGEAAAVTALGLALLLTLWATRRESFLPTEHRDLLLVGFWYVTLLMISPESRTPHFLTLFTPSFALALAASNPRYTPKMRRALKTCLGAAIVFALGNAEIFEHARYHLIATGVGFYAWAQVTLAIGVFLALRGSVVSSHSSGDLPHFPRA